MKSWIMALFLSAQAVAAPAVVDQQEYLQRAKGQPAEVQQWLRRAIQCFQLKAEPSYDSKQSLFLKSELKENRCTMVQRDGTRLASKYHKKPLIAKAIKDAKRDFGRKQKPIRN